MHCFLPTLEHVQHALSYEITLLFITCCRRSPYSTVQMHSTDKRMATTVIGHRSQRHAGWQPLARSDLQKSGSA